MIFLLIFFPKSAFAYLDPGTGSALIYAIFGLSFALFYTIKGYFYSFTNFILKGTVSKVKNSYNVVFFTEGGQYKNTFIPILKVLDEKSVPYKIFTLDEKDGILENKNAECVGSKMSAFAFLNSLSAKMLITTTPQLDVLQFKKSKKVKHYAHIVHSCTDFSFYKRYAFDHFDSIFISGSHQEETARELEDLRGFPQKTIVKAGLCYFDEMVKSVKPSINANLQKTLLIAPSWGANGMFTLYGTDFLKAFTNTDFKIIVRPHPQIKISQPEIFTKIEEFVKNAKNFELDLANTPEVSLSRADFLLSDFSGIIFDFAFLKEMPVFIFEYSPNLKGYEAEDLPHRKIWELEVIKEIGILLKQDELANLPQIILNLDIQTFRDKIIKIRNNSIYNFGKAGEKTAEEILKICSTL